MGRRGMFFCPNRGKPVKSRTSSERVSAKWSSHLLLHHRFSCSPEPEFSSQDKRNLAIRVREYLPSDRMLALPRANGDQPLSVGLLWSKNDLAHSDGSRAVWWLAVYAQVCTACKELVNFKGSWQTATGSSTEWRYVGLINKQTTEKRFILVRISLILGDTEHFN